MKKFLGFADAIADGERRQSSISSKRKQKTKLVQLLTAGDDGHPAIHFAVFVKSGDKWSLPESEVKELSTLLNGYEPPAVEKEDDSEARRILEEIRARKAARNGGENPSVKKHEIAPIQPTLQASGVGVEPQHPVAQKEPFDILAEIRRRNPEKFPPSS